MYLRLLVHDMGPIRRVVNLFKIPSIDSEKRTVRYRCLRCGEGFERNHHSCPTCGARFVVAIDGMGAAED